MNELAARHGCHTVDTDYFSRPGNARLPGPQYVCCDWIKGWCIMNPASRGVIDGLSVCRHLAFIGKLQNIWIIRMDLNSTEV